MRIIHILLVCILLTHAACGQEDDKPVLLINPTVHTGSGKVYDNAALAYAGETITLLADARLIRLDMSAYAVVEAYGLHVYPAAVTDTLPEEADQAFFYLPLAGNSKFLLCSPGPVNDYPVLSLLQEGEEATFVVTDGPLDENSSKIRYLVIKGRLKRESGQALLKLASER